MGIEQVGIGATVRILRGSIVRRQELQHVLQNGQGMSAIEHTCPETDLPAKAPSRSLIATVGERLLGSGKEFVVAIGRNLIGGEQSVEVGDMAMMLLAAIGIDKPLLQLLPTTYLHRRNLFKG